MTSSSALLTWNDVARQLANPPPEARPAPEQLARARLGWFGVLLETTSSVSEDVLANWLESVFPGRVSRSPFSLELDAPAHAAHLPVEVSQVEALHNARPNFGIIDGIVEFHVPKAKNPSSRNIPVVATLSVKGGTGRTTTAVAFALHWARICRRPILLVDADLEAPGLSYLLRDFGGIAKISLEDVILLAHAEESSEAPETVSFAAERLRDHSLPGNLIILPLRRDLDELASSSVRAEHLSTPENPFALADVLSRIADRLGCGGVVVDVRAGLVPLGVNLAMDPNVSPVIITTLADQALKATASLVRFIAREIRRLGGLPRKPLIVINRVPAIFRQSGMDTKLIEPLIGDLLASLVSDKTEVLTAEQGIFDESEGLEPFSQIQVPELPDIQVSSGNWTIFADQIVSSGFSRYIEETVDQWINSELGLLSAGTENIEARGPEKFSTDDSRKKLAVYADQLIAAENITGGTMGKPLVTKPLTALTERFQSEVPIAISEGAKGTGKTLAARYFIAQGNWSKVVQELIGRKATVSAVIVPVCASVQSSEGFQKEVDAARSFAATEIGGQTPMSVYETSAWLKEQVQLNHSEQRWIHIWLNVIAWSVGIQVRSETAGEFLIGELRNAGQSLVALIEGLEELYTSVTEDGVQSAMRAALVSLPQRLRSELKRPLGLILFARRDTVETAVRQNLDQYRREYSAYALTWTDDDVLELAAWLATQAGALPGLWNEEFGKMPADEKVARLDALWGRKLGPDDLPGKRIREAYTATWVIAVLSDFQGRLVPRDLIRLLSKAAAVSMANEERTAYAGRLLIPRALKNAVEPTSEAKVKETEEEISELKPIFSKFRTRADQITAPIGQQVLDSLEITQAEILTLQRHGIVIGEKPPYDVPELFRRGLGLRHAGARRSVVNLYRRARSK